MPSTYDDLIAEGATLGVDADYLARLTAAAEASPLRTENKSLKEKAAADAIELAAFKEAQTAASFKAAGILVDPKALALPADLDIKDVEAVKAYGMTVGLVAKPATPPTPDADKAALEALGGKAPAGDAPDRSLIDLSGVKSFEDLKSNAQAGGWSNSGSQPRKW